MIIYLNIRSFEKKRIIESEGRCKLHPVKGKMSEFHPWFLIVGFNKYIIDIKPYMYSVYTVTRLGHVFKGDWTYIPPPTAKKKYIGLYYDRL